MARAIILYKAKQEIFGKHLRAKEWVGYSGELTVYDRKTKSLVLKIKSEIADSFMNEIMNDRKEFKSNTVTDVYAKLSKWLYNREVIFQF